MKFDSEKLIDFVETKAGIDPSGSGAIFSACGQFRYLLWRCWNPSLKSVHFIGLNPSRGDSIRNDPTIRRCIGFARSWGCGALFLTNLFAYRHPDPRFLRRANDPVGRKTDHYIRICAKNCARTIVAWGNGGQFRKRNAAVLAFLSAPYCLGINKTGAPAHPLYLKRDLLPVIYPNGNNSERSGDARPA